MKKPLAFICFLLIFCAVLPLCPLCAETEAPGAEENVVINDYDIPLDDTLPINTKYALLYNADEKRYLYKKQDDALIEPASTVKLMLGVVAFELYAGRFDEEITVTKQLLEDKEGLSVYIEPGEVFTIRQLLYIVLMYGANDAAMILARLYTGNVNDFILLMNDYAARLGCENTTYRNVTGLHADGATTTLADIIRIAVYAEALDGFTDITSTARYSIPSSNTTKARTILSRNALVSVYLDNRYKTSGVTGMSYGSTDEMGDCLVVSSEYGDVKYFIALMGGYETEADENGKTNMTVYTDAIYLLSYAQTAFAYTDVLDEKKIVAEVPVVYSSVTDYVSLVPTSSVTLFLPANVKVESEITTKTITYSDSLQAPVDEGQIAGEIVLYYNGGEICRVKLKTTASVARSKILYVLGQIKAFVLSVKFIASAGAFVVLLVAYILIKAAVRGGKKRRRRKLR